MILNVKCQEAGTYLTPVEMGNHKELMKLGGYYRNLIEEGMKEKDDVELDPEIA